MSLKEYVRKRDFKKTAEPRGDSTGRKVGHRFVVQKHAASRLHYDFRLELGGTLKSWAVPKGMPYRKGERRLAMHVEDHPVSYIDFEGTIPKGQYGGGTVMVWDQGTFEPLSPAPLKELERGKLHFVLQGEKLQGEWYLVQMRGGNEWLLIKGGEDMKPVSAKADDTSVLSGKTMAALSKADGRVWQSNRTPAKSFRASVAEAARKAAAENPSTTESTRGSAGAARRPRRAREVGSSTKPAGTAGSTRERRGDRRTVARPRSRAKSKPTPAFIEPMKALLVAEPPSGDWIYEIKFDGFRAIAYRDAEGTRLLSRNNKDLAGKFPEIVKAVAALDVQDVVIDGEVVALDEKGRSSFQLLQAYDMGQQRPPLLFYAFDLLQLNGRDLRNRPLSERKSELEQLLHGDPELIRFSASLGGDVVPLLEQARKLGLEGLIGKRPDSVYEPGRRSGAWIKLKLHQEQEFVIGGYTAPGGSRTHFGALLVGVYDKVAAGRLTPPEETRDQGESRRSRETPPDNGPALKFAGKVGTGFDAKQLKALHARFQPLRRDTCPFVDLPEKRAGRYGAGVTAAEMKRCTWIEPELVAQIRFAEWTRDHRLRQPVFVGLREDKSPREVVREKQG